MVETKVERGVKFYSWGPGNGYGDASKAYMLGLASRGIPVTWTPLVPGVAWASKGLGFEPYTGTEWADKQLAPLCNRNIPYDTVIAHIVPEYFPAMVEAEIGKRVIGCTVWETDKVPAHWPDLLNSVDRLLVPCAWNREVFQKCGVTRPIEVIPHILPEFPEQDPSSKLQIPGVSENDFLFYTIGTWTTRKAMGNTVGAYLKAFSAGDPVALVIKTTRRDFTRVQRLLEGTIRLIVIALHVIRKKQWVLGLHDFCETFRATSEDALTKMSATRTDPPQIILCTDEWPREQIEQLHRRGDCFVSLCHSEGWGLGAFEAAGLGRPVIMTRFGGQLDYLPPDLAHLVDYRLVPVIDPTGGRSYTPDQNWAEADTDHAAALMRSVFENPGDARRRGVALSRHVAGNFNEEAVIARLLTALENSP